MNVYPEILPMQKSLIDVNINAIKAVRDTGDTDFKLKFNQTSPNKQREIGSVTLFGSIRLSSEQSPQMLQKGSSKVPVRHELPPSNKLHKNLIGAQ